MFSFFLFWDVIFRGIIFRNADHDVFQNNTVQIFCAVDISEVPRRAYTMGIRQIMQAKKILILASGTNKADAVYKMVKGKVTEDVPASILQLHSDCTLIADRDAATKIK